MDYLAVSYARFSELHPRKFLTSNLQEAHIPMNRRSLTISVLTLALCGVFTSSPLPVESAPQFHFAITESFMQTLAADSSLLRTMRIRMDARSGVHTLSSDCEIHVGGSVPGTTLGTPNGMVVEPPNLCKIKPEGFAGNPSATQLKNVIWPNLFDDKIIGRTCEVNGFLRLFTEHAAGGGAGGSNPDHVFEIHPALSITCDGEETSFRNFLKIFPGMRAITPGSASSCIRLRDLSVRFKNSRYQFKQQGGTCGNFAIIEVSSVVGNSTNELSGGHSTIGRVTADGENTSTLKLYTLSGSESDTWLADVMQNGFGTEPKLLHGLFTYDIASILRTLRDANGQLTEPSTWQEIDFPLAFVVFGDAETAPWE